VYTSYSDVRAVLTALSEIVPAELKGQDQTALSGAWDGWAARQDREIRARLERGDEDTIVNALLELPGSRLRSAGYLTVQYSDRPDDGDHIVWYRRLPE
jgi:hypothetical protein